MSSATHSMTCWRTIKNSIKCPFDWPIYTICVQYVQSSMHSIVVRVKRNDVIKVAWYEYGKGTSFLHYSYT